MSKVSKGQPMNPAQANDGMIVRPGYERIDERGTLLELLNSGRWESILWGQMKAQAIMGQHYHQRTDVCVYLLTGRAEVVSVNVATGERSQSALAAREGVLLPRRVAHALRFLEPSTFLLLKSLRYDPDDPDTFAYRVIDD